MLGHQRNGHFHMCVGGEKAWKVMGWVKGLKRGGEKMLHFPVLFLTYINSLLGTELGHVTICS